MSAKASWIKRSTVMLAVAMVACLAAINSLDNPTTAAADPIANWSLNPSPAIIPTDTGADVTMTINDPIIYDGRYVTVDKLHFPGQRYQTIDIGISPQKNQASGGDAGYNIVVNTLNVVGSGYLFSTSGVYSSTATTNNTQRLLPPYGVYYGYNSRASSASHSSATITVVATGDNTQLITGQNLLLYPLVGKVSAVIWYHDGHLYENRYITPGGNAATDNFAGNDKTLGTGNLLIGGVGGSCLGNGAACTSAWTDDGNYKSNPSGSNYYRASMFSGDVQNVTVKGNPKVSGVDSVLFAGIPAFDIETGYCGLYDTNATSGTKFFMAENPELVTCTAPSITASSTSPNDTPNLVFDYTRNSQQCEAAQAQTTTTTVHACMTPVNGTLRFSAPPLPGETPPQYNGWVAGPHPFQLTITTSGSSGTVVKTIDFTLIYVRPTPPGTLSIDKRAWLDVPPGTSYDDILAGGLTGLYQELKPIYDGSADPPMMKLPVLPSGTFVTFTFTVLNSVPPVPDTDFTGRSGLSNVLVQDDGVTVPNCPLLNLLVNVPVGCTARVEMRA